jgi:hypothetical protein
MFLGKIPGSVAVYLFHHGIVAELAKFEVSLGFEVNPVLGFCLR